jgi:dsDNA-specific endonuclease/ATPase MutS2
MKKNTTHRTIVDVNSANTSKVGFNTAVKILKKWGCKTDDMVKILHISKASFLEFKTATSPFYLNGDQLIRISYILNIHAALKSYFSNPENVTGFMTMKNNNPFFGGRSPLHIIKGGEYSDLHDIYCRIEKMGSDS